MTRVFTYPMLAALWIYRALISPALYALGIRCRHEPSCSAYSREAILRHGPWVGGWLTLSRLLRCQPFGTSGVDNVPETVTKRSIWTPWQYGVWRLDKKADEHDHDHIS